VFKVASAGHNAISGWYDDDNLFHSRIEIARYRFGKGEYKYFAIPLPGIVAEFRTGCGTSGNPNEFPADLQSFLQLCHSRGQRRSTPILSRYRTGDSYGGRGHRDHNPVWAVRGVQGFYRANIHHGVSALLSGRRHTLGILFHDAKRRENNNESRCLD
jgi:hypothetical protein